jgi:uncharacterized protein (TIGR02246 family)
VDDVDARAIRTIFDDLEAAFSEHDASKFDSRFTSDIIFTAVNGQRFHGWDDIHSYHKERLENHADGIRTWYEIDAITFPAPTVAIAFVRQPVVAADAKRSNVGTWVLTKKSGRWWVCAIQNTGVVAPPME